jgi:ribosomal-protein-alanine N-acetyltransferase
MTLDFFDRFPELQTQRLLLREIQLEDAPALFEIFSDPEVTRFYDVETMVDVAPAVRIVAQVRARFADRTGVRWAITEREGGRFIGSIGFNTINIHAHRAVVGYELARSAWGRGLATEALRRVVHFGHQRIGVNRIEAIVMQGNEASIRVLKKAGFEAEGVLRAYGYWKGRYHDLRMFSILRPCSDE